MTNIILPPSDDTNWKIRAVRATHNKRNQDLTMVCLLLAVLGWQAGFKPRFGRTATINKEGMVFTECVDGQGKNCGRQCLGHVEGIRDSFRGLADHLKLSDAECNEMFLELKRWFSHDARANESNSERGLLK